MIDKVKDINIKDQTYYFFNDIFDIENMDPNYIKVGHSLSQKICIISFIEIPIKMIKNVFYFKILKFLSWLFWSCRKNGLTKKMPLTSKLA